MYTLDTNAIIYYLRDEQETVKLLKPLFADENTMYVSSMTEIELFGYPNLSQSEHNQILRLLNTVSIIPVDSNIARIAGNLRRIYRTSVTDSAIASTALFTGSTLVTRNIRDFQKVPGLKLLKI